MPIISRHMKSGEANSSNAEKKPNLSNIAKKQPFLVANHLSSLPRTKTGTRYPRFFYCGGSSGLLIHVDS